MDERDFVAFVIYCTERCVEEDKIPEHLAIWQTEWIPELTGEHTGSCVQIPGTCMRCWLEEWYAMADAILKGTATTRNMTKLFSDLVWREQKC